MYSYGPPHMDKQKQDDQLEHTYSSYVRIRDVTLKTCQKRWMIGRSGERGSGISVLAARHHDDDEFFLYERNKYPLSISMLFLFSFRLLSANVSMAILKLILELAQWGSDYILSPVPKVTNKQ